MLCLRAAGLAALLWFVVPAQAQNSPSLATTNVPPPIEVKTVREELQGIGAFFRVYITVGTNKMALLVPQGFRMHADAGQRRIVLAENDERCVITVQLHGPVPPPEKPGAPLLKPEVYRDLLLQRHPAAKVIEEYTLSAAGQSGPAFDAALRNAAGLSQRMRVAFIPTPAGVVEFNMLAGEDKFAEFHAAFNSLLLTFRAAAGGKLDIAPLSNKL
ncbi:MAG: hypothetical protein HY300_17535 [Verrucomicrobia bacterium]|nr:hypothetical protein [Verrucomicrobiota bacterium]